MALHAAKNQGGNYVLLYTNELKEQALESFKIEHELKVAIRQQQLVLHYQAQVDFSGKLIGALATPYRWLNPSL